MLLRRLSRKQRWALFGSAATMSGGLFYFLYTKETQEKVAPRKTTTLTGKHLTQEDVVNGRQVLWNLRNFKWKDIPSSIARRYLRDEQTDSLGWRAGSTMVIGSIGLVGKFLLTCLETTKVYHMDRFLAVLHDEQRQRGLITVSNHLSVWDDPILWGVLPMKTLLDIDRMRWVLGAADICYTTLFKATFFSMGKAIPTIRGGGIYQPAVDFAIQKLNHAGWIHVFPEGKVNQTPVMLRFKWGIGRLIMESDMCPIVIPVWHQGMEHVRPLRGPFAQFGRPVIIVFGEPLDCQWILKKWKSGELTEEETRIQLTDMMVEALKQLKEKTRQELERGLL